MRLADVGAEGQQKWLAAEARVVGEGLAARVEALYLAGAGIGSLSAAPSIASRASALNADIRVIEVASPDATSEEEALGLDPAANAVASGALRALRVLKAIASA